MIKLAIVDDHQIVIDGIKSLLKGTQEFEVVVEDTRPEKMLETLCQVPVDILLTDVMMPGMNGDEFAKEVKIKFPQIKILALSMNGQGNLVNQMIRDANISGYVLKNIGQQELIIALKKIAAGGIYFSEEVLAELNKNDELVKENERVHLTQREIEIIQLIEKEMSNKQIAAHLFLSEKTVETHRKNIYRKTETNSLIGLVKFAYEHHIITSHK